MSQRRRNRNVFTRDGGRIAPTKVTSAYTLPNSASAAKGRRMSARDHEDTE